MADVPDSLPKVIYDVSGAAEDSAAPAAVFEREELAIVLSFYDIGLIEDIRTLQRGSRKAPKLIIKSRSGEFLLKRRAPGRDDPYRVAFTQSVQVHLSERGYPVPRLIGTRFDNNSMLQLHGTIYELFQYVEGARYDHTEGAAVGSGAALGALHRHMVDFESAYEAPVGGYHDARDIDARFEVCADSIIAREPDADREELRTIVRTMQQMYHHAAAAVNQAGFRTWQRHFTHGDWHPGNLLFRGRGAENCIVAVLDFDSARLEPAVADLANGLLQFSMRMGPIDAPQTWPVGLDERLLRAFWRGYHEQAGRLPDDAQRRIIPRLILEALILECIVPIAATGTFGRIPGGPFLQMIARTARWIVQRTDELATMFLDQTPTDTS